MEQVRRCRDDEREEIFEIVNAAAEAYRGVIPTDRWHEPYMPHEELDAEIAAGVAFWGYEDGGRLVGIMGIQDVGDLDLILCMTVNPGWGGQAFLPGSLSKLERLRAAIGDQVALEVDGGIDVATAGPCARAGASVFVAGSAVFGAEDPGAAYRAVEDAAHA